MGMPLQGNLGETAVIAGEATNQNAANDSDVYILPEKTLMMAVITNAVLDACGRDPQAHSRERSRKEALRWFRDNGPDYQAVCALAGYHPEMLRSRALTYIAAYARHRKRQPHEQRVAA